MFHDEPITEPASFADARRRWSSTCPANQLESLVQAATLGSVSLDESIFRPIHVLEAAQERILHQKHNPDSGRTLLDAITVDTDRHAANNNDESGQSVVTALQRPFFARVANKNQSTIHSNSDSANHSVTIVSDIAQKSTEAAKLVRLFLTARDNLQRNETLQLSLRKSLALHQSTLHTLALQRGNVLQMDNNSTDMATRLKLLDDIKESEENSKRVMQQLERQLSMLDPTIASDALALSNLQLASQQAFKTLRNSINGFRDPVKKVLEPGKLNNMLVMNLAARQGGLDRFNLGNYTPRSMGRIRLQNATRENRLGIIKSRFSHAVTINTHWTYPVYCLRFDRTGRYFITGADDFLAKVFCLGSNVRPAGRVIDPASIYRGAVLVCTLRGHAGVINDIDVSSDNGFLATASEDGD
jgi:hypothetical protein